MRDGKKNKKPTRMLIHVEPSIESVNQGLASKGGM
jgi:hypothetical protein